MARSRAARASVAQCAPARSSPSDSVPTSASPATLASVSASPLDSVPVSALASRRNARMAPTAAIGIGGLAVRRVRRDNRLM